MIEKEKSFELNKKFERVLALKDYDINDVKAGREYIYPHH